MRGSKSRKEEFVIFDVLINLIDLESNKEQREVWPSPIKKEDDGLRKRSKNEYQTLRILWQSRVIQNKAEYVL